MNKNRKKLCPFRGWALENFPFIENNFDALTNYAMISKMTNYINSIANDLFTVETNLNEVVDVVNDLELDIDELAELINSVNINLSNLTVKVNTLENKIPTKTSQLINDSDFTTKNLFDKNSVVRGFVNADGSIGGDTNAYRTSDFIPIQPNTTYYKTRTDSPRTKYYDINKQPLNTTTYQDISIGGNAGTFTTPNNAYYLRFSYPIARVDDSTIQIEKGNQATSYVPHKEYTKEINLGELKVGSIGEYDDEFFKNTIDSEYYDSTLELDKWYLKKRIGKVVLDGSESYWAKSGASTENVFIGTYNLHTSGTKTKYGTGSKWLVNRFTYGALGDVDKFNTYNGNAEAGYMFIGLAISTSLANDLAAFKNWLSANNVELHYVLATPINIEITDSTLIYQLEKTLYSYNGQTNISQTNNDLPFILDVKALELIE